MSTRFRPTKDTLRQKKLKWMNIIVHAHDTFCDCCKPLECTIGLIINQEPELTFNTAEKDALKKCLTGEDTAGKDGDQDVLGEGDLEDLFKEDFGDENTR